MKLQISFKSPRNHFENKSTGKSSAQKTLTSLKLTYRFNQSADYHDHSTYSMHVAIPVILAEPTSNKAL